MQAFSREPPPPIHPPKPQTSRHKRKIHLNKTKGWKKKHSTLCHAVIFFCRIYHRIPFSGTPRLQFCSQVHDFTKTLANVWKSESSTIESRLRKKINISCEESVARDFFWREGAVESWILQKILQIPKVKPSFRGIHAWLGRLWVPWWTHGKLATSGNIAGWRNGCIFPKKLIFQTLLSGFTKGLFFLLEIREFPASWIIHLDWNDWNRWIFPHLLVFQHPLEPLTWPSISFWGQK